MTIHKQPKQSKRAMPAYLSCHSCHPAHPSPHVNKFSCYEHAPSFVQDNEFIRKGYRVNMNYWDTFKSLFHLHNEWVNVWTHLLGGALFLWFLIHTIFFLAPPVLPRSDSLEGHRLLAVNQTEREFSMQQLGLLLDPIRSKLPDMQHISAALRSHLQTGQASLLLLKASSIDLSVGESLREVKEVTLEKLETLVHKMEHGMDGIKGVLHGLSDKAMHLAESGAVQESLSKLRSFQLLVKNSMSDIAESVSHSKKQLSEFAHAEWDEFLDAIHGPVDSLCSTFMATLHPEEIRFADKLSSQQLASLHFPKWPIVVFILSAIACLSCSAVFHLFCCHSPQVSKTFGRLDYSGITILIAGSFFPPVYYGFYCSEGWQWFYLTGICCISLLVFCISFREDFHNSQNRVFRVLVFIGMSLFAIMPFGHLCIKLSSFSHGYNIFKIMLYTLFMGALYIFGACIYSTRVPERFCPGFFDIFGHSHQLWHLFVLAAALVHYAAALENYNMRWLYSCHA